MSRYIVTECPACTTRFQVTAGQLKLAAGKVRCGACLEVFNAEVYRCDDIPDGSDEPSDITEQTAGLTRNASVTDPAFDAIDIPSFVNHADETEHNEAFTDQRHKDERLAEQLNNSPDTDLNEVQHPTSEHQHSDQGHTGPTDSHLTSDATASTVPQPQSSTGNTEQGWTDPLAESVAETLSQSASIDNSFARATVPDPEQTRPFTAIRAEPVMIKGTQTDSSLNWSGLTLVILALLLFCGQFFWFNRQPLSTLPELTQIYEQACQHLPCQLLPVINLEQIDTRQLVVQEHSRYQGALSVSLLVENIASTDQPYPAVRLSFADRKGKLISQRLFQPEDYLNNRQLNLQKMPAQQMVQISFDILDPGRRAVSYEASLEAPRIAVQMNGTSWQSILFGRFL